MSTLHTESDIRFWTHFHLTATSSSNLCNNATKNLYTTYSTPLIWYPLQAIWHQIWDLFYSTTILKHLQIYAMMPQRNKQSSSPLILYPLQTIWHQIWDLFYCTTICKHIQIYHARRNDFQNGGLVLEVKNGTSASIKTAGCGTCWTQGVGVSGDVPPSEVEAFLKM